MYRAYSTRASDQGPNAGKWDNSPVMAEILALPRAGAAAGL
jgi:oligopeptidase A